MNAPSRQPRHIYAAAALALMWILAGSVPCASAELKPTRVFDLAKPATVMVQSNYKMQVTVPVAQMDQEKVAALRARIVEAVQQGQVPNDQGAIVNAFLSAVLEDPLTYFVPTNNERTVAGEITAIGSGFVVNPNGYIVTNAHVVAPGDDALKKQLAIQALRRLIDADAEQFAQAIGAGVTPDLLERFRAADAKYYVRYMTLGNVEKAVFAATGVAVPGVTVAEKGRPAEVTVVGAPIPGKDVAVLKVEGGNLITLPPGDDAAMEPGDRVYVVGYPGAATFHPALSKESQVEPSLTNGTLSAKKSMPGGWSVLQTDAAMTHGNSGGPVLDSSGRVVGIATFGSVGEGGQEVAGMNFVVPISVVKEFLGRVNVQYEQGVVSRLYVQAVEKMDRHYYRSALKQLTEINAIAPGLPYIQAYLSEAQKGIADGKDESWKASIPWVVGLALLAAGGVGLVMMRRRQRGEAGTATIRRRRPPLTRRPRPTFGGQAGQAA